MKIGILCGGSSSEFEVSVKSGLFAWARGGSFAECRVILFGASFEVVESVLAARTMRSIADKYGVAISDTQSWDDVTYSGADWHRDFDVFVPLFHGCPGEDGQIQGFLQTMGLPYVGCDLKASAFCIDKFVTKELVRANGVPVARGVVLFASNPVDPSRWEHLGYPVFVKPTRSGSSIGVGRARDREECLRALKVAFSHDSKVLIEEEIIGEEISFGFVEGLGTGFSVPGRMALSPSNYAFDAKYGDRCEDDEIPKVLAPSVLADLLAACRLVTAALELRHLARIDFFVGPRGITLNEVNTIPGLGGTSVFNQLWEKTGYDFDTILEHCVWRALERPAPKLVESLRNR